MWHVHIFSKERTVFTIAFKDFPTASIAAQTLSYGIGVTKTKVVEQPEYKFLGEIWKNGFLQ